MSAHVSTTTLRRAGMMTSSKGQHESNDTVSLPVFDFRVRAKAQGKTAEVSDMTVIRLHIHNKKDGRRGYAAVGLTDKKWSIPLDSRIASVENLVTDCGKRSAGSAFTSSTRKGGSKRRIELLCRKSDLENEHSTMR